ncbi:MAG: chorismate synthase [Paludibacteraceae bacterium]|nr:chorismate synthase [Paludibacteraceae bacterium]
MNTFGTLFRLTCFGESHGVALGGVIDGCPAGVQIDEDYIQQQLDRRRPGQSELTTARKEADKVQFLSGIFEGKTTGTPIGFIIANTNQHSSDYANVQDAFRPSHADYTYTAKYGFRDYRGGGRSSARETACWVVAGAVAQLLLRQSGLSVQITASITEVGGSTDIESTILQAKQAGDTVGGIISCTITGVPAGWGEPVFDKLQAKLAAAMLSINAAKGFDYGMGFDMVAKRGSQVNDIFETDADGRVITRTNYSGGIQGGISNGMPIYFRVAFKPVATLMQPQDTIDAQGNPIRLQVKGRHDACVLPRALPIVESMAALVLADAYLLQRNSKL